MPLTDIFVGTQSISSSSQKVYVLAYDATLWAHEDTTESITLLDGQLILVSGSEDELTTQRFTLTCNGSPIFSWSEDILVKSQGTLGVYLAEAEAKRVGEQWLHDQLFRFRADIELPLKVQDGSEWEEPVWMKSGLRRTANDSWEYSISHCCPRNLLLVVHVSERTVGESDPEEEHEDSDDNAEKPTYVLVGPPGCRKRVRARPQTKEKKSGGQVGPEGQDRDGGDAAAGERENNQEDGTEGQDTDGGNGTAGAREDESREAEEGIQDMHPDILIGPPRYIPDEFRGPPGPST